MDKTQTIDMCKKMPGFKAAYERVKANQEIRTGDLVFFNISFESFLRYANLSDKECKSIIAQLIKMFE